MRFTDRSIKALKAKRERYEKWEDGRKGLGVRVSPAGRMSWVYMYRFEGRARRMTLGTYPALSLAGARVKHAKAMEMLEKGTDPGALLVGERRAEREAETIDELAEDYLEKWARPRKRSAAEDERLLRANVLPHWGRRKAKDITRRDVIALLDGIVERGAPISANRTLAVIRRMFNFAVEKSILEASPVALMKAPAKENQRDRVLNTDEIRTLWHGLDTAPMSPGAMLALKLQLVTAQRKGEVVGAPVNEFDLDGKVWTIAASRAKNGQAHRVPLSPLAVSLITEALAAAKAAKRNEAAEDGDERRAPRWLFPSPKGDRPINPQAVDHALKRATTPPEKWRKGAKLAETPAIAVADMTPHDMRRTAASHMTALGISRLVVSKVLNHAEAGVTAVYDRHSYDPEKRHALEVWAAHLEAILGAEPKADNVVKLATAARPA